MAKLSNGIGTQRVTEQGGWIELHCLGAGGFGHVTLYENKVSRYCSSLKQNSSIFMVTLFSAGLQYKISHTEEPWSYRAASAIAPPVILSNFTKFYLD